MAQSLKLDVKDARDSASVFLPDVKSGNILAADYVLKHLGINTATNWSGSYATGNPIWGRPRRKERRKYCSSRRSNTARMPYPMYRAWEQETLSS